MLGRGFWGVERKRIRKRARESGRERRCIDGLKETEREKDRAARDGERETETKREREREIERKRERERA
jgi:hypothetical protein